MRWLLVSLLILPTSSYAAVTINEVAWMGDSVSANHEWIELYNDGASSVNVSGWTLTDGMNLNITLEGVIEATTQAVLERSSEESAPGTAFLVYTGALVNSGATLQLQRADGGLEDQVAGGENWGNIGGDNTTKETAQYTTSGWITAAPTPGQTNKTEGSVTSDTEDETKSSGSSGAKMKSIPASEPVVLILPGVNLQLAIDGRQVGYVQQEMSFTAEGSGIGSTLLESLSYDWNFGDGYTANGKSVTHRYQFPGTYVVTVYGNYKRQNQVARFEVTVLPVTLSLTRNKTGDLQINNDSPYEIDISGYQVVASREFVFAPRSVMLPNQTVTLKSSAVGGNARVYDETGQLVVSEQAASASAPVAPKPLVSKSSIVSTNVVIAPLVNTATNYGFKDSQAASASAPAAEEFTVPEIITIEKETLRGEIDTNQATEKWPYLFLILVILIASAATLYRPNTS